MSTVDYALDGEVAVLTVNYPPVNALIPRFDELDSSNLGQARAALEHFQGVMRQHLSALV